MAVPEITLLFDGDCPICSREVAMLQRWDRGRGRFQYIDIADADFDATSYGSDWQTLMKRIHGVLPDGTLVEGVEVFRRCYAAVGRGWMLGWTAWPGFRWVADAGYRWFARNRLRLTGREDSCPADRRDGQKRRTSSARTDSSAESEVS